MILIYAGVITSTAKPTKWHEDCSGEIEDRSSRRERQQKVKGGGGGGGGGGVGGKGQGEERGGAKGGKFEFVASYSSSFFIARKQGTTLLFFK